VVQDGESTTSIADNNFGDFIPVSEDHFPDGRAGQDLPRQTLQAWNPVPPLGRDHLESLYSLPTPTPSNYPSSTAPSTHRLEQSSTASVSLNFTNIDLVPLADSSRLGSRWLNCLVTSTPPKRVKPLSHTTVTYAYRVLKTYPKMMLQLGRLPPIIHPLQLRGQETPVPLANCLSLVRMWEGRAEGSEDVVNGILTREMERLFGEVSSLRLSYLVELC
jgi:hypothetical protein